MSQQEWARKELRRRIDDSGLGVTKFSKTRLIRDPSTVHRWLAGARISDVMCEWLLGNWRILENNTINEQAGN